MPKFTWYEVDQRGKHQHATRLFDTEQEAHDHAAKHSRNAGSPSWWHLFVIELKDDPEVEVIDPEASWYPKED